MSRDEVTEPERPHSPTRFRIGVALLVLAGVGVVASIFTNGLLVKALWACLIPGATFAIYGWRGPDPVHNWPDNDDQP